ncbi:MAG: hypothetical protein KGH53_03550 [Candidatus Micrarchaeota archaeon]|nr:hypothetical protein [Candidatus Micrarchaeota archaeon]
MYRGPGVVGWMAYASKLSQLYKSVPSLYHYASYLILGAVLGLNLLQLQLFLKIQNYFYLPLFVVGLCLLFSHLKGNLQTSQAYSKICTLSILNCAVLFLIIVVL